MTKVSVVIPVYNVERYLSKCLDSVINQTMEDIEIICVNDGSTDNSLKILKEYAEKDNRIRIIDQKNKGLGAARNVGVSYSCSEYIMFLDSDDYLIENAVGLLYRNIIKNKTDIASMSAIAFADADEKEILRRVDSKNKWLEKRNCDNYKVELHNYADTVENYNCVAWGKLFAKSFLNENHIRFIENHVTHEDNGFWLKICANFPTITYIPDVGIMYRIRAGAITEETKYYKTRKRHNILLNIDDAICYIKKYKKQYSRYLIPQIKNISKYNKLLYTEIPFLLKYKNTPREKFLYIFRVPVFNIQEKGNALAMSILGIKHKFHKQGDK